MGSSIRSGPIGHTINACQRYIVEQALGSSKGLRCIRKLRKSHDKRTSFKLNPGKVLTTLTVLIFGLWKARSDLDYLGHYKKP